MVQLGPLVLSLLLTIYLPFCAAAVKPTGAPSMTQKSMAEFWVQPKNLAAADTYYGPWGDKHAPDSKAVYTFVATKTHGNSPGLTVRGPDGVEWSVKQGREGPVEVTLSRVLTAVGYHQPPGY